MSDQIIVTDVTRMLTPKVCIAGLRGSRAIRLNNPQPNEMLLTSIGGLFPGDRLRLTWLDNPFHERPHVEDGTWDPRSLRKLGRLTRPQLIQEMKRGAANSIEEAFGPEWFRGARGNGAFHPGEGARSLASIVATDVRVYQWFEGVRVDFADAQGRWTMVPLEDLSVRRHQQQCPGCLRGLNQNLKREFSGTEWLLRVGLTRPYKSEQHETACWLQVTGVYPVGRERRHFV